MPLVMVDCVIENNGRSGICISGLKGAAQLSLSLTRTSIRGNGLDGVTYDISDDRAALGIPASVPDSDVLRAAEIAKTNASNVAFTKIKDIASWAALGIDGASIIKALIDFIQS
jgi:hypothetical protein